VGLLAQGGDMEEDWRHQPNSTTTKVRLRGQSTTPRKSRINNGSQRQCTGTCTSATEGRETEPDEHGMVTSRGHEIHTYP
jgi:hypothetical protein